MEPTRPPRKIPIEKIPIEKAEDEGPEPGRAAAGEPRGSAEAGGASEAIATEEAEEAAELERAAGLEQAVEELNGELRAAHDRLLRLQAEFDNYRKREARERAAAWARAKGDLTQKLLGALDDLSRVAHLDPSLTPTQAVIDGILLVENKMLEALRREGLTTVGEVGEPFDPRIHEAIGVWPAPTPDRAGRVAAVTLRGYQFGHQLLRPAQVQVYEQRAETGGPGPAGPSPAGS
ncbi:MAG TPA: nucleotide exchange factor GrpE [Gemmatimonadota bacterium]|nr:nucleotide exchange factor GrpE [Gemmatimonadota bacterium]